LNLVVVLPIKRGARDRARALLDRGPAFDGGVEAFLTEDEVVFHLRAEADLDRLAPDWAELAAGPPRGAEGPYWWVQPHPTDEAFSTPTPGPGDSEGGDVFAPEVPDSL
jgi:hypothetical protein